MTQDLPIRVVAAVIIRADQVLVARRGPDQRHPGCWEFPGGKIEPGETDAEALRREIEEELTIAVRVDALASEVTHAYPHATIHLRAYVCEQVDDRAPTPSVHSALRWVHADELEGLGFADADRGLIAGIRRAIIGI